MLRIENMTKVYPNGTHALNGVSLTIPTGQFVAIIGLSGSGKSTLLRCINRLIEPTAGKVFLDDIECHGGIRPEGSPAADRDGLPAFQPRQALDGADECAERQARVYLLACGLLPRVRAGRLCGCSGEHRARGTHRQGASSGQIRFPADSSSGSGSRER